MCLHTTMRVLMQLYMMFPHTAICVLIGGAQAPPQYMRPHTRHATIRVRIQLYMFPRTTMCPHRWCASTTPICASSYYACYYACPHTRYPTHASSYHAHYYICAGILGMLLLLDCAHNTHTKEQATLFGVNNMHTDSRLAPI